MAEKLIAINPMLAEHRKVAGAVPVMLHEVRPLGRGSPLNGGLGEFVRGDVLEIDRTPGHRPPTLPVAPVTRYMLSSCRAEG